MHYEGTIIRPPSEAQSILLQVTVGCSHNKCRFCGAYKAENFRVKERRTILEDLATAAELFPEHRRLFLCDGDVLILPQQQLVELLDDIKHFLPNVQRVGLYANAKSIVRKSPEDLLALKAQGLHMVHMGLESGDTITLQTMEKWGTAQQIIDQGIKIRAAGLNLFVTVILGLGGRERSAIHAEQTGKALTAMNPPYVGVLSLIPTEGTSLYNEVQQGTFSLLEPQETLLELRTMLMNTELHPGLFYANHASNFLPLRIRMPRDKNKALAIIESALRGEIPLTPEWLRGL